MWYLALVSIPHKNILCYNKSSSMWFRKQKQRRRKTRSSVTTHYCTHKEAARRLVHDRLAYFNTHYGFTWNRVAIRNPRRSWGSCTSLRNLNFSYKILFLPPHLRDYIIVHELCHLAELNHGEAFWQLVALCAPAYVEHVAELRAIDRRGGGKVAYLTAAEAQYLAPARAPALPRSDRVQSARPSL